MKHLLHDQLSGLFWMAISILVVCGGESIRGKVGAFHYPGPGFLPLWSGVGLGVFSIILVVQSSLKKRGVKIRDLWIGKKWGNVIWIITSLFVYAILLPRIGYLITTFALMTLLYGLVGRTKLWIQGVTALITALLSYLVFNVWLQVRMPDGILGF
jgi:putative tricarboxylic transport membrane protein